MGRGGGSVLKKLKSNLQEHDLLQQQKRKKGDAAQARDRRERDRRALDSIRQAFNPFDLKFNRQKSELKSRGQEAMGRPAAARQTGEAQRKRTWDAQKRLRNKAGGLVDRRFGERDNTMTEEDKMVERYARERLNRSKKSFNIEDDDDEDEILLTHKGQTLSFQDDFAEDDLGVSDGSDYERPRETVESQHNSATLGDGSESEDVGEEPQERKKTKQEVMKEVVAKSKLHKLERQQIRAQDDNIVDTLNAGFDDLMADLQQLEDSAPKTQEAKDTYDSNVLEMMYDRRAQPGDRTKTAEELAQEEEERRREANRALHARMEGDELDIGGEDDDAGDDGELFGLHGFSDEDSDAARPDDDESNDAPARQSEEAHTPESLKELEAALTDAVEPSTVIKGLVARASKSKLAGFAVVLAQYACKKQSEFINTCSILHEIAPTPVVGIALANGIRDMVHRTKSRPTWSTSDLLLFALIGSLFSTSDQWHVVVTSASLVITQRLSQSVTPNLKEIADNLFLCDLLLTYQRLSKRYIPEILGYMLRVLAIFDPASVTTSERCVRLSPEEVPVGPISANVEPKIKLGQPIKANEACVLIATLSSKAASLWRSLDAFAEAFSPILLALKQLDTSHKALEEAVGKISKLSQFSISERKFLELQQFKPVGIVTKMPLFDENYNPDARGSGMDSDRRELAKLKALHKRERKSTLREIRRDAEFEARQKLSDKRKDMAAYHEKLKRLEGQINGEEGAERNAYERERKKRRRH